MSHPRSAPLAGVEVYVYIEVRQDGNLMRSRKAYIAVADLEEADTMVDALVVASRGKSEGTK
jgi:hypothetical protein